MKDSSERPLTNYTQRRVSRRRFMKGAGKAAAVAGITAATGTVFWKNIDRFKEYEDSHSVEKLLGKPIPGEEPKDFITDKYPDSDLILVRKHPLRSDGEILGYADSGQKIKGQAVYGVPYDSYDSSLGGPIWVDGEGYGKWYEIDGKDLAVHDKNGQRIDTSTRKVYLAGNFLKVSDQGKVD